MTSSPRRRRCSSRATTWADVWFNAFDNREAREKYLSELKKVEETERNPEALSYERERAWETRRSLEGDRKKLTATAGHERPGTERRGRRP